MKNVYFRICGSTKPT